MLLKDRRFFGSKFGWILVKGCAQTAVKFNSEIWTVPPRKPVVQEDVGKNRIDLEIHFSLQITPRLQDTPHDTTRFRVPIPSMYGIFTYIYHENQPNVGKYTIHGSSNPMQFIYCSQNRSANSKHTILMLEGCTRLVLRTHKAWCNFTQGFQWEWVY